MESKTHMRRRKGSKYNENPEANMQDLSGERIGRVLVRERYGNGRNDTYMCECDCGLVFKVRGYHVRNEKVLSCGCIAISIFREAERQKKRSPGFADWMRINRYKDVPASWKDFSVFIEEVGTPEPKHYLDRIDKGKSYSVDNVIWRRKKIKNEIPDILSKMLEDVLVLDS